MNSSLRASWENIAGNWQRLPRPIRVVLALSVGSTIVAVGVALLVLPGPGIAVIILGLAILATEFAWARRLLHRAKHHVNRTTSRLTNKYRNQREEGTS